MRFSFARTLAAVAALALVVVACGADEEDPATPDPGDAAEEPDEPDEPDEGEEPDMAAEYDGDRMTLIVTNAPGGGNDTIARAMAPYLSEELGVNVVVENMVGGGGLLALNHVSSLEGDNETIVLTNGIGTVLAVMVEAEGVEFDLDEMNALVRMSFGPRVLFTSADAGRYQTMDEVMAATDVRAGSSGPGSSGHIDYILYYNALGVEGEIITGFDGSSTIDLSLHQGDIDLHAAAGGSNAPKCIEGEATCLLTLGREPFPGLEDVPTIMDLDMSDDARAIFETHLDTIELGRIIFAPPGVDEGQLAAIEGAILAVLTNQDFLEELATLLDEDVVPIGREETRALMDAVLNADQTYVDMIRQAYQEEGL